MEKPEKPSIPARRDALKMCKKGDHAGLLLNRYLRKLNDPESIEALQEAAIGATPAVKALYEVAFARRQKLYKDQCQKKMKTLDNNRLIIGLGNTSVLDAGLALHHTYGTPMIPGSALKGLCAHHARERFFDWRPDNEQWQEKDPALLSEDQFIFIFGDTNKRGNIIFHDAWIEPGSLAQSLKPDVMTPHHRDYYGQNEGSAPTDFDSPIPNSFLSVGGTFEIILSAPSTGDGKSWIGVVWTILKDALETRGIGGKTSSGYGRMEDANENLPYAAN